MIIDHVFEGDAEDCEAWDWEIEPSRECPLGFRTLCGFPRSEHVTNLDD